MLLIKLLKYYPVIVNLWILIDMIGYFLNVKVSEYSYTLLGHSLYLDIILLILSLKFKFCLWHQILILSSSFYLIVETLNIWGLENNYYFYVNLCVIAISICVATILYKRYGCFKKVEDSKCPTNNH